MYSKKQNWTTLWETVSSINWESEILIVDEDK